MKTWPKVDVSAVCSHIVDCVNRTAPVVDYATPYRMIRTTNVRNGTIDLSECRYVTKETFDRWTRRLEVRDGDVILTREAPIGEVGYINGLGQVFLGQRIMQYRPDPNKVDGRFFFYAFQSPALKHQFGMHDGSGSVVSHIRVADCHRFLISLPPRSEQEAIANLLGALDDKIELNRRMNETLEQMAQAIFKDWFVGFGPVRRKQEGASDPIAIMGGLVEDAARAAELAALFSDTFGDDGLPEGWRPNSLGQLFEIKIGRTPPRKEKHHFVEKEAEGIPWLSIRDLGTCGTFVYTTSEFLTVDSVKGFRVPLIEKGTVVVSFKLTVGRVAIAERQMLSNEAIAQLAVKAESPPTAFTYSFMKQYDYSQLGSTSSIATAVNSESIRKIALDLPPEKLLSAHHGLVDPLLNLIQRRGAESRTLAETRDYLLPKLMSGEVRVRDAETQAESLLDA